MPPAGSCSCGDWHNSLWLWETLWALAGSEREGCNPLSGFELFSDWHPDPAKFAKSFEVWPLQADLRQHFWHLWQVEHKTIESHKKHFSHTLIYDFCNNNLLTRDFTLSFGSARAQNEQLEQHDSLHLNFDKCLMSVLWNSGSRPAVPSVTWLYSNCHLEDCWPLVGHDG